MGKKVVMDKSTMDAIEAKLDAAIQTLQVALQALESVTAKRNHKRSVSHVPSLVDLFDSARKAYPGKKRSLKTEFVNFKKKCPDWEELLEVRNGQCALEWVIGKQIDAKDDEKRSTGFTPNWCAFSVWINQRKFEEYLE